MQLNRRQLIKALLAIPIAAPLAAAAIKPQQITVVQTLRRRTAAGKWTTAWSTVPHPTGGQWTWEDINKANYGVIIK